MLGFFPNSCMNFYKNHPSRKWYLLGTKKLFAFLCEIFLEIVWNLINK